MSRVLVGLLSVVALIMVSCAEPKRAVEDSQITLEQTLSATLAEQVAAARQNPFDSVNQLICIRAERDAAGNVTGKVMVGFGTGTVIDKNTVLTANHVIHNMDMCSFAGSSVRAVLYSDGPEDVAVLKVITDLPPMPTTCKGYVAGEYYRAMGFPGGLRPMVLSLLRATAVVKDFPREADADYPYDSKRLRVFDGLVMSGMSGGPVFDREGNIAGVITASLASAAANRDLRDTKLCK